jgi:hypothetical protein
MIIGSCSTFSSQTKSLRDWNVPIANNRGQAKHGVVTAQTADQLNDLDLTNDRRVRLDICK